MGRGEILDFVLAQPAELGAARIRELAEKALGHKVRLDTVCKSLRKGRGKCLECSNEAIPGKAHCAYHRAQNAAKVRKLRAECKAKGLCWRCKEKALPGSLLCFKHRKAQTTDDMSRYARNNPWMTPRPKKKPYVFKVSDPNPLLPLSNDLAFEADELKYFVDLPNGLTLG